MAAGDAMGPRGALAVSCHSGIYVAEIAQDRGATLVVTRQRRNATRLGHYVAFCNHCLLIRQAVRAGR